MGQREKVLRQKMEQLERIKEGNTPTTIDEEAVSRIFDAASDLRMIQKRLQVVILSNMDECEMRQELERIDSMMSTVKLNMLDNVYEEERCDREDDDEDSIDEFLDARFALRGARSLKRIMDF